MSVIRAKDKSFFIDYSSEVLPPLFRKQDTDSDFSKSLLRLDNEALCEKISQSKITLLISTEQLNNRRLIRILQEKADSGVRVYLLLGDAKLNQDAIGSLSGRCLVRTGVSQKGALILADHSTSRAYGVLATSQNLLTTSDEMSWAIQLETLQLDDAYRSFCKLFWEQSQDEYLLQNERHDKAKHPDGNIFTNHSYQLYGTLKGFLGDTLANLKGATSSAFDIEKNNSLHRLLLNSNSVDGEEARLGVALTDTTVPSLLISEQACWLLPDVTDFDAVNWCLSLSDKQSKQLTECYEQSFEKAAWQYQADIELEELSYNQEIRFADQPDLIRLVEQQRSKTLEPVLTQTIDSFLKDSSEELAQAQTSLQRDFLAQRVEYNVIIHPPYCPKSAKKDDLYALWKKAEIDWLALLSDLEHQQGRINQKQANIADKFKGLLKGFLLGQGQSVKKLDQELLTLKKWSVTRATPAEREEQSKRLETLMADVSSRSKKTDTEIIKAEQKQLWEEKKKELEKQQDESKRSLSNKLSERDALLSSKDKKQLEVEESFLQAWKATVKLLTEKQFKELSAHTLKLNQSSSKQISKESKEDIESILLDMDYSAANELRQLIKEKTFKKHYRDMSQVFDDYQQGLNKIERDCDLASEGVANAKREEAIAAEEYKKHGEEFVFRADSQSTEFEKQLGVKSSEKMVQHFGWPKEDLPMEGAELKAEGKKRWLVINNTEQLEQARKDAELLNATICVNN